MDDTEVASEQLEDDYPGDDCGECGGEGYVLNGVCPLCNVVMLSYLTEQQIKDFLECRRGSVKQYWPYHAKEHEFSERCLQLGCKRGN